MPAPLGARPAATSLRRRRFRLQPAVALLAGLSVLGAACSSGGGDQVQAGTETGGTTATSSPARDVLPDPGIELTEDTVIVRSDGGRAVKAFPDDPDTIVIDASAKGASELDSGDIMLLTGVTVVRVAELEKAGDELRITGAPVTLPEVIRNGDLKWDAQPVDMSRARVSVWDGEPAAADQPPAVPGAGGVPAGGGVPGGMVPGGMIPGGATAPGAGDVPVEGVPSEEEIEDIWGDVNDVFGGGDGGDLFGLGPADLELIGSVEEMAAAEAPIEKLERGVKVKVDGVEYSVSYSRDDKEKADVFKLAIESASGDTAKNEAGGEIAEGKVKGSIETQVSLKDVSHSGNMRIVDGGVQNFELAVPRLAGEINVDAKFQALSMVAHMTSDPLFDLPLSLEFPVLIGGVPFTLDVKVGVQVNLSLAMLDNTLNGLAKITFDGDAGFKYAEGQLNVFGKRVQDVEDLLDTVKGVAEGPVGLVFTNELPKLGFSLGYKGIKAGVFLSNGYVVSFHILPMPAPCTATNVSYVLASGVTADFFGLELEVARKAITEKQWHFQIPQDQRCNT